jgi:hypothetical protein
VPACCVACPLNQIVCHLCPWQAVVQRRSLFDDPADRINALVFRIKEDIQGLNHKLDSTQVLSIAAYAAHRVIWCRIQELCINTGEGQYAARLHRSGSRPPPYAPIHPLGAWRGIVIAYAH